jgi:hypothetical protein
MSPKNKSTKRDIKQEEKEQEPQFSSTTTTNTTTTIITTTNTTENETNGIVTPPIIKINRKYSRLSLNSSYESLPPESRSCSSTANTTPSRSRLFFVIFHLI